ncbi:MAG: organic hydroperoxide resistance protein [Pseudomonadota bacterium]
MATEVLYTTKAIATGGREGQANTLDGSFEVTLSTPKELGGDGAPGNNPEQLFASGYAACFLGAMKFVAFQAKDLTVPADTTVTATVGVGPRSEGGFGLEISLDVATPGLDAETARKLVEEAHQVCPYSNATRNNIDVKIGLI